MPITITRNAGSTSQNIFPTNSGHMSTCSSTLLQPPSKVFHLFVQSVCLIQDGRQRRQGDRHWSGLRAIQPNHIVNQAVAATAADVSLGSRPMREVYKSRWLFEREGAMPYPVGTGIRSISPEGTVPKIDLPWLRAGTRNKAPRIPMTRRPIRIPPMPHRLHKERR